MVPFQPKDFLNRLSIKQPLLFINSYSWQWKENIQSMLNLLKSCKEGGNESCSIITLRCAIILLSVFSLDLSLLHMHWCIYNYRDTDHFNQTDVRFVLPEFAVRQLPKAGAVIPPVTAHQVNLELCHAFLRRHLLKGLLNLLCVVVDAW